MKTTSSLLIACTFISSNLLLSATTNAAVLTTTSNVAPAQDIVFSATPTDNLSNFSWNDSTTTRRDIGISFKASANTSFNQVTVRLSPEPVYTAMSAFQLSVYETDAFNATPVGATEVYSSAGALPAGMSLENPYLSFTLDQNVSIQSGKFYVITYRFTGNPASNSIGFAIGSAITNPASDSQMWYGDITDSMTRIGGTQFNFYVQSIPEPSSGLCLLFGSLFLTAFTCRRGKKHTV